jgi:hypothetical protein
MLLWKRFRDEYLAELLRHQERNEFCPISPDRSISEAAFLLCKKHACHPPQVRYVLGMCIEESFDGLIFHISFSETRRLVCREGYLPYSQSSLANSSPL